MWSPEETARHARDARRLGIAVAGLLAWWAAGRLAVGPSFGPGGAVFAVFVVLFSSFGAGRVVARFPPMPALLGQLVAGFLLRNIPTVGDAVGAAVDARFSAAARTAALGIVLARAGLSLDVKAVYRLRWAIKRLAFGPATAEALVVTLLAKPALGLPWSHCAALGYLFAGISPAVVVPSMLALQDHGRGVKAGVPALAITAASVDVVYAIAGFGVASSWLPGMGAGGAAAAAWQAPTQIVGGALGGVVVGKLLGTVLPPEDEATGPSPSANATNAPPTRRDGGALAVKTTEPTTESSKPRVLETADGYSSAARAVALMALVQLALFAGARWEFSGGAALLSLVMSTAAAQTWGPKPAKETGLLLNAIWAKVGEPLLFGLIGAAVDASRLKADVALFGILTLAAGLAARCVCAFFAAKGGSLSMRDRLFIAVAWTPKATVQAALAGLPFDAAVEAFGRGSKEADRAETLLALGVLSILITAPLGAAAMAVSGERLLEKDADECSPRGTHSPRRSVDGGDPETGAEDVEVLEDDARLGRGGHF
uniref:Monovalent Cation:Proton antiporter-1 family n=2 Tax=Micromonas pusilla TaxID=38833 RepID=A0A7S0GTP2_MICPS|mmetsp:Transcript_2808/g.11627  ORF Transcript_2808/g.11627 Transcript_2808/m.11627 type:complete len:542 (+) Transcript_2808:71-1696(+)